jgi:hypothetical protein
MVKKRARKSVASACEKYVPGADTEHPRQNQASSRIPGHESQTSHKYDFGPAEQKVDRDKGEGERSVAQYKVLRRYGRNSDWPIWTQASLPGATKRGKAMAA